MLSGPHAYAASCLSGLPKCASESCSQKCIFLGTPARHQQRRSVRDQSRIAPTQRPTIGLWSRLTGLRRKREAEACRLRHTLEISCVGTRRTVQIFGERAVAVCAKEAAGGLATVRRPCACRSYTHTARQTTVPNPHTAASAGLYVCNSDLDHAQFKLSFARLRVPDAAARWPGQAAQLKFSARVAELTSLAVKVWGMGTKSWAPRSLCVRRPAGA